MPNDVLEDPDCTQSVIFKKSGMFTAEILGTINYYLRYTAMNDYVHVRERERVCVCVCVCACVHVCVCVTMCAPVIWSLHTTPVYHVIYSFLFLTLNLIITCNLVIFHVYISL